MPIQLKPPIVKDFILEKSDLAFENSGSPTMITIRQATQEGQERRAELFSKIIREMSGGDGSIKLVQQFSFEELKRIEVMLTLSSCNITDENGNALFVFSNGFIRDEVAFRKAWGRLDPMIADEIHEKVLEVNIKWGPEGD